MIIKKNPASQIFLLGKVGQRCKVVCANYKSAMRENGMELFSRDKACRNRKQPVKMP